MHTLVNTLVLYNKKNNDGTCEHVCALDLREKK